MSNINLIEKSYKFRIYPNKEQQDTPDGKVKKIQFNHTK